MHTREQEMKAIKQKPNNPPNLAETADNDIDTQKPQTLEPSDPNFKVSICAIFKKIKDKIENSGRKSSRKRNFRTQECNR